MAGRTLRQPKAAAGAARQPEAPSARAGARQLRDAAIRAPAADRHLAVHGLRIRVRVQGSGPPLLLVMGIGGNVEMWEPLVAQLGEFTTIAFDAPGTGDSQIPPWPLRMKDLARLAAGILDALSIGEADVLGVSYGGAVAQELAHRHPGRVRRLILAATMCGVGGVPGRLSALALLATPYRYYSRAHFKAIAGWLYGGEIARRPDLLEQQAYSRLGHAPSLRGYLWQLVAITGWSSLPYLHRIRQPVLVLTGDEDPIIRVVNGRILAALLPNAELHVLPGAGHLFLLDQAAESAALIRRFLGQPERVASGSRRQNSLPAPIEERTVMSPPARRASSLER